MFTQAKNISKAHCKHTEQYILLVEIPIVDCVQKDPSKIVLKFMKVTASILFNVLEENIHSLL